MKAAHLFLLICATTISTCARTATTPPERMDAPVIDVMRRAQNQDWLVRVHADSVYEGAVTFVQPDAARVGPHMVALDRITQIDRSNESGSSDAARHLALATGIGFSVAYVAARLLGGMRKSTGLGVIGLIGFAAAIGAISISEIDGPAREWETIWHR